MAADPFCGVLPSRPYAATPLAIFNRPGLSEIAYRIGTFATFREAMLEVDCPRGGAGRLDHAARATTTPLRFSSCSPRWATFWPSTTSGSPTSSFCARRASGIRCCVSRRLIGYRLRPGLAAQTLLSFALDAGAETRIRKGLKVMSVPGQDEKPQIFETIEQIVANAELSTQPLPSPRRSPFNGFALGLDGRSYRGAAGEACGWRRLSSFRRWTRSRRSP